MNKNPKLLIGVITVLVVILVISIYFITKQHNEMKGLVEQSEIEKEELEEEYSQIAIQYEGYKLNVNNDSLIEKFENEKLKVQRLLDELKTVKSTNSKRISELKKELATVRAILRSYIAQVDSLNRLNQKLTEENKVVKERFHEISQTASQLKKEKEKLINQVDLASKLDAVGITVEAIDRRSKKTTKISKTEKFKICFTIAKNVTAQVGEKDIFVRILKPDEDILIKNLGDVFKYEDREINYSVKKMIEYTGEEMPVCIYWNVEEFLYPGKYRIDIFTDGNLIGSKGFSLDK